MGAVMVVRATSGAQVVMVRAVGLEAADFVAALAAPPEVPKEGAREAKLARVEFRVVCGVATEEQMVVTDCSMHTRPGKGAAVMQEANMVGRRVVAKMAEHWARQSQCHQSPCHRSRRRQVWRPLCHSPLSCSRTTEAGRHYRLPGKCGRAHCMARAAELREAGVLRVAMEAADLIHTAATEDRVGTRTVRRRTGRRTALELRSSNRASKCCYTVREFQNTGCPCAATHGEEQDESASGLGVNLGRSV